MTAGGDRFAPIRLLAPVVHELGRYPNLRFRLEQWAPYLRRDHGIEVEFLPYESPELSLLMRARGRRARKLALAARDLVRRWMQRHEARRFDGAIVVHEASTIGGAWFERHLSSHGIPFIYDFDDAIWVANTEMGDWTTRLWRAHGRVPEICAMAGAVTVGNEFLAAFARRQNANVHVVPTSVELSQFRELPPPPAGAPFTIVWMGSTATLVYLDSIRDALERLGKRMPVRLRVIANTPPAPYANVTLDFVKWSADVEAPALGAAHVGVMPLPDTETTRGKCGLKAIQYMAAGRAVVLSPVGMNADLVQDGRNGLWAATTDDWLAALERLARDPALRDRLAKAGRRTVEERYSAETSAAAFARAVRSAIR